MNAHAALDGRSLSVREDSVVWALADHRHERGDTAGAERMYRRAVEHGDAAALEHLARLRERTGDHTAADRLRRFGIE